MYCEIRKVGFVNKGAELMLLASAEKLNELYPNMKLVMKAGQEKSHEPYFYRSKLGLYQKPWAWKGNIQLGDYFSIIPKKFREMFGIVLDKELDLVLDASGFSYSDQWGEGAINELIKSAERWKKNGTKLILMPQAFGPFSDKLVPLMKRVIELADIIYARDEISYDHVVKISGEQEKIKLSPDFTNLVKPLPTDLCRDNKGKICVVPNYRMVDKTDNNSQAQYISFLSKSIKCMLEAGEKPFILVHEGEKDLMIANKIKEVYPDIEVVTESNPLKIKGIIGECKALVGSRFHSLVSALSLGVPVIATGWSHKYEMLLNDYGVKDCLISINCSDEKIKEKLNFIIEEASYFKLKETIVNNGKTIKTDVQKMWDEISEFIREIHE